MGWIWLSLEYLFATIRIWEDHSSMNVVCTDKCGHYAVYATCASLTGTRLSLSWPPHVTFLATSRMIYLVKFNVPKHRVKIAAIL